jgi:hypothetical protein
MVLVIKQMPKCKCVPVDVRDPVLATHCVGIAEYDYQQAATDNP